MASNSGSGETSPPPPPPPAKIPKTSSTAPTSAITVAENIDLITSILARIEAKTLMRFKSVSKQWLSLISSPNFSHIHTLLNPYPKPSLILFDPKQKNAYEFVLLDDPSSLRQSPPFYSGLFSPHVLASCNGLLLCSSLSKKSNRKVNPAYVFNPATKQSTTLMPPPTGASPSTESYRYSLAFDPSKSPHYRVILVRSTPGSGVSEYEIHIYSSETRSWKKHGNDIVWPSYSSFGDGVYLNGAMHWISKSEGSMCFDIDQECTRSMPPLPGFPGWPHSMIWYFGQSDGDLHIVDIHGYIIRGIYVFVLEKDYSNWSVKYRIDDMDRICRSYGKMVSTHHECLGLDYYTFTVVGLLHDGDEGEWIILRANRNLISYSFKSQSIKLLRCSLPMPKRENSRDVDALHSFDGHFYTDTLAYA